MKRSNKLIFGYLSFLWVTLIITLVISFAMTPQGGISFGGEVRSEKFEIDDISVVKIKNTSYLRIVKAD